LRRRFPLELFSRRSMHGSSRFRFFFRASCGFSSSVSDSPDFLVLAFLIPEHFARSARRFAPVGASADFPDVASPPSPVFTSPGSSLRALATTCSLFKLVFSPEHARIRSKVRSVWSRWLLLPAPSDLGFFRRFLLPRFFSKPSPLQSIGGHVSLFCASPFQDPVSTHCFGFEGLLTFFYFGPASCLSPAALAFRLLSGASLLGRLIAG